MPYSIPSEVRDTTGFNDRTNISEKLIQNTIEDADSTIDSKAADKYALPLAVGGVAVTPKVIRMISRKLAICLMYQDEYGEESEGTDKGWVGKCEWVMGILDDIQEGKMKLRDDSGVELDRSSLTNAEFYPTAASSEPGAVDSTEPKLTMNQKF